MGNVPTNVSSALSGYHNAWSEERIKTVVTLLPDPPTSSPAPSTKPSTEPCKEPEVKKDFTSKIYSRWGKFDYWFEVAVVAHNKDGTYHVRYRDGLSETGVKKENITLNPPFRNQDRAYEEQLSRLGPSHIRFPRSSDDLEAIAVLDKYTAQIREDNNTLKVAERGNTTSLSEKIDGLETIKRNLLKTVEALIDELDECRASLLRYKNNVESTREELQEAKQRLEKWKLFGRSSHAETEDLKAQILVLKAGNAQLQSSIADMQSKVEGMKAETAQLKRERGELKVHNDDMVLSCTTLRDKHNALKAHTAALEERHNALSENVTKLIDSMDKRCTAEEAKKKELAAKFQAASALETMTDRSFFSNKTEVTRFLNGRIKSDVERDSVRQITALIDTMVGYRLLPYNVGEGEGWKEEERRANQIRRVFTEATLGDCNQVLATGKSLSLQSNDTYTLVGGRVEQSHAVEKKRHLVKPLNLQTDETLQGCNSIVWNIAIDGNLFVLKGVVPFIERNGYDKLWAMQESELIPSQIDPHCNIVKIYHAVKGSSALVAPWIQFPAEDITYETIRSKTLYIVMERYDGTINRLAEVLTERQIMFIAYQVLSAVRHLAKYQIVHGDIKADNIFKRDPCGTIALGDFGCSFRSSSIHSAEDIANRVGNPNGVAPEVNRAIRDNVAFSTADEVWALAGKNDVYAVAVLLYSLAGVPDHMRPANNGLVEYSNGDLPDLPSHFSAAFRVFLEGLIAFNPRDRYTAGDAVDVAALCLWGPSSVDLKEIKEDSDWEKWILGKKLDVHFDGPMAGSYRENCEYLNYISKWKPSDVRGNPLLMRYCDLLRAD